MCLCVYIHIYIYISSARILSCVSFGALLLKMHLIKTSGAKFPQPATIFLCWVTDLHFTTQGTRVPCCFVNLTMLLVFMGTPPLKIVSRDSTIPLGSLCIPIDAPSHKTPIKMPPSSFLPHPGFYVFILYILSYKRQYGSACELARCGVQSSGIFVALWPTCVVLSRYVSSPVGGARVIFPRPGSLCFWEAWKRESYRPSFVVWIHFGLGG